MKKHFPLAALFLLLTASCALSPRNTGNAFMFVLPHADMRKQAARADKILLVSLPDAATQLDTFRIALKRENRRWDYYHGARWSDFLPVVVQDDLTRTLAISHIFKSVATDETGGAGDVVLKTDIRAFQADYATGHAAPVIRINLAVTLVSRLDGTQIAAFSVADKRKASANTLSAIQAAFAAAFMQTERQLVQKLGEIYK